MLNRRAVSRYHLVEPLRGFIEHGEARYRGEIVELSTAGFRLRLPGTAKEAFFSAKASHDFGELIHDGQEIGGFGEIRYVRAEGSDLWIGFKWDDLHATDNIQESFTVIAELVAKGIAGCVNMADGLVELVGHVSAVLAEDVGQCLAREVPRLSLRECSSVDASGLAMLLGLEDAKVRLEDVGWEIAAQLQRLREQGRDAQHGDLGLLAA